MDGGWGGAGDELGFYFEGFGLSGRREWKFYFVSVGSYLFVLSRRVSFLEVVE